MEIVSPPSVAEMSIVMIVSVTVCLCVSVREYIRNQKSNLQQNCVYVTYGRGSALLWRRCDMLCNSGFMHAVIFAYTLNGQEQATRKRRILKSAQQARFDTANWPTKARGGV